MSELESGDQDIYEVLGNERRRLALECLLQEETLSLGELANRVAVRETEESPPPEDKRHSVYTALARVHLPKLDALGVVHYDGESQEVALDRRALNLHLEVVPRHELAWAEYYLALGVLGLVTVGLATFGVPLVARVDPLFWAAGYFGLYIVSGYYHLRSPNRQTLGRDGR